MFLNYYGYDYWNNNSLSHHGIKGQKWGVRRFQNLDGSLTDAGRKRYIKTMNKAVKNAQTLDRVKMGLTQQRTIPAGTIMYRTSATKNEQKKPGESTYVTYLEPERNLYRGGFIRETAGADVAYEKTYQLKTDLKIPSRTTCETEIKKLIKNPELIKEINRGYLEMLIPENSETRLYSVESMMNYEYDDESGYKKVEKQWITKQTEQFVKQFKNLSTEEAAFRTQASLGLAPKTKAKLIEALKKQGYNAMVDEASVGGRFGFAREGIDPLIVFDSGDLTQIKEDTINKHKENQYLRNYYRVRNRMSKNSAAQWSDF